MRKKINNSKSYKGKTDIKFPYFHQNKNDSKSRSQKFHIELY